MGKIAIITDSTCDLPSDIIEKYDIKVMPLRVNYKDGEYRDRVEISPKEIYERMSDEIPKTSLPSPMDVCRLFENLQEEGYTHVLAIVISSGLSGTYNMVENLVDRFEKMEIKVLDSKSLSLGLGMPVIEAAKEVNKSNDFSKVVERTKESISRSHVFFVVKTLEYLKKGGRIGLVEGTVGELLGIKPIIAINEDGKYYTHKKVRGRKKSIEEIYKIVKEQIAGKKVNIAVMHANVEKEGKKLLEKIEKLDHVEETFFGEIGPVMGVHTGAGLIGVVIFEVMDEMDV